mgnify:CR=1
MNRLLNTIEVSQMFGVSEKSLANSRNTGTGMRIPYIKIGRLVRYKESDVETYINNNYHYHTGQEANYEK